MGNRKLSKRQQERIHSIQNRRREKVESKKHLDDKALENLDGLGAETTSLPAYVAMTDPKGLPVEGVLNWSNGWLPSLFQGTVIRPVEPRILNLQPPRELQGKVQENYLRLLGTLNQQHFQQRSRELELQARLANLDLATQTKLEIVSK